MSLSRSAFFVALSTGLLAGAADAGDPSMANGLNGFGVSPPLLTIGETLSGTTGALNPLTAGDYTPPGVLDGLGAYELDADTVRVFANHELLNFRGYPYEVSDGLGGSFSLTGARVSYFDIDKTTRTLVDAGLAYGTIYDANGEIAADLSFLIDGFGGFSRFCSSALFEAGTFGLEDTIYFTGEEDGGAFNAFGGAVWALDAATGDFWAVPAFGRGAWENVTLVDSGDPDTVAFILADDSSPFDFGGGDPDAEAAPLYLYVGEKDAEGDFLARNGLVGGSLYVWVADDGELGPLDFAGSGSINGSWVEIDNARMPALASDDGSTGYDKFGYPTQGNLWLQAEAAGSFGFSRPEDVAFNPFDGSQVVLASTGVDTYAVDPVSGDGADTFGTLYLIETNFVTLSTRLEILYDGDADPTRALRSPDNLDWADDGAIYIQEDKAETDSLTGELLFGPGAANPNEAGVVRLDPVSRTITRVMNIDRNVILDGSLADPGAAVDVDAGSVGDWESSGILDVSTLFGDAPGTLFLIDIQAHGIEDQDQFNAASRIVDSDLVEGGQLLFLEALAGKGFVDAGNALAGTHGAPALTGSGSLGPNAPFSIDLSDALANADTALFAGFSQLNAPFKGGVLVPSVDLSLFTQTSASGEVSLSGVFPAGALSGLQITLQFWTEDAGAILGVSASNAITGTTP